MISPETRVQIRRYFYAEHWKIGTIASELGVRDVREPGVLPVDHLGALHLGDDDVHAGGYSGAQVLLQFRIADVAPVVGQGGGRGKSEQDRQAERGRLARGN